MHNLLLFPSIHFCDDGCLSDLACLAEKSDEVRAILTRLYFVNLSWKESSDFRWKLSSAQHLLQTRDYNFGNYEAIKDLLHSAGLIEKSVQMFLKRILSKKITCGM